MDNRINYLLDTCIVLNGLGEFIEDHKNCGILLSRTTLSELDGQKTRDGVIGYKARKAIREIKEIKKYGKLHEWIKIENNIHFKVEGNFEEVKGLNIHSNDDLILATLPYCIQHYGSTVLVTNDISFENKAEELGFEIMNYYGKDDMYKGVYSGKIELTVNDDIIDKFYKGGVTVTATDLKIIPYENQFIIMKSTINPKKTAVGITVNGKIERLKYQDTTPSKLKPRNLEQKMAIELLMRDDIPMVTMTGAAGSAKSILQLSVAIEKVLDNETNFKKIVLAKPPIALDKNLEVGFKKGTIFEKYIHTLGSITSNLEVLKESRVGRYMNGIKLLEGYIDQGIVEICSIEDILGSSYNDCIILAEEMQLMTKENIFSLLSRCGSSRIFVNGDLYQSSRIIGKDPREMGLFHAINVFKDSKLSGHLKLEKIQRSEFVEELYRVW